MVRALIADDSPSARALVRGILGSDPEIEVVGEARDGAEAVALTRQLHPDVVTLDLDMPRLDGFGATREIMISAPTPIVIVSAMAGLTEEEVAVRALGAGALAVLRKPAGPGVSDFDRQRRELVETVKAMAGVKVVRRFPERPARAAAVSTAAHRAGAEVVTVATSTGGPPALHALFGALPQNFPAPILVVQHIADGFTNGLVSWLATGTRLRVKVASAGEATRPGTIYLAPDDRHLGIAQDRSIVLSADPPIGGFRPSGTFLFESAARSLGKRMLAVILTGMGRDGVEGLRAVRAAGAPIIAEDEKTAVIFGMPGAAIAERLADFVLPLSEIAPRLVELTRSPSPPRRGRDRPPVGI